MRNTVNILGVAIDKVSMDKAVEYVEEFLEEGSPHSVYTPNSEILMEAQRDSSLKQILNNASLVIPDGAGVVLASRILGTPLTQKVPGFDLVQEMFKLTVRKPLRFFFFGGTPGIAEAAAEVVKKLYPGVEIRGCRDGYFKPEEEEEILEQINSSRSDILLAALGCPKQEIWIDKYINRLDVKICIGVGGTLDILAGKSTLAPEFFRKNGLEWLYRLYKEPRRFRRMMDLPRFMLRVIWHRIRHLL